MSQPKSYASTTRSTATSLIPSSSSSSITGTALYRKSLSQAHRRAPPESDEYMSPTTVFTAFVGGGGNSNHTYTHSQKRGDPRSEHEALTHEHGRNAGVVVPVPSKPTIPASTHIINKNNYNDFHYRQKGQNQPATTYSTISSEIGGKTYDDLAEDSADDDDVGRSEDGDRKDDRNGDNNKIGEDRGGSGAEGQRQYRQRFEVTQSKRVFGSDYLERSDVDLDLGLDLQSQPRSRILQSRMIKSFLHNGSSSSSGGFDSAISTYTGSGIGIGIGTGTGTGIHKTPPTTQLSQPTTTTRGSSSIGVLHTHPNQANTNTYNRHHQSRHYYRQNQTNGHQHQRQHQSVPSNDHGHGHAQGHRYNASRQLRQNHPRAASSSAFYNTNPNPPTSPPTPSSSSPPSSRTWRASRTSPPTAPPRVSSLLPPPRSTTTTTNTSSWLPLSTFTVTTPIIAAIAERPTISTSTSIPAPNPSPSPNHNATSDPASTTRTGILTPPPSNVILQEAPTHAQFASSFLDPLNNTPAVSTTASVLASGAGSGFGSGVPGSGVGSGSGLGSGAGPGPDPSPPARRQSHSRASSFGTAGDTLRNLNRWSSSTASSRLSAWDYHHYQQQQAQQQKSIAFARRMSVDSIGVLSQPPEPIQAQDSLLTNHYSSPRKLIKRRPSQGTSASPGTRARAGSASASTSTSGLAPGSRAVASARRDSPPPPLPLPSSAPPPNLPPIISLSPLDPDPESSFRLGPPRAMSRASPNLNPPNSVFASQPGNAEPQDYFWSGLSNPIRTASPAARSNTALLPPASVMRDRDIVPERRGHLRSRSAAKGGSGDSTKPKDRSNSKPSQKAMLSKALNKANTAVQLDNAQNYGAAREAYLEACELLQQVLTRTNGDDDRKKLDNIVSCCR
ncbi:hypothetical protein F4824DRAFT_241745 [Ustulina deusta]|nr:hypothetical protein F4824DRAFT_241745 [Ustulina deusta]